MEDITAIACLIIGMKQFNHIHFSIAIHPSTDPKHPTLSENTTIETVCVLFVLSQKRHNNSNWLQSQAKKKLNMYKTESGTDNGPINPKSV